MIYTLLCLLLLFAIFAPQLWVKWIFHKYSKTLPHMPGTGSELAEHLLKRFGMEEYKVEKTTKHGDHFDPQDRAVRLSEDNFTGKSLTAVAVAAHEVGHAIQHHRNEKVFQLRSRYIPIASRFEKLGIYIIAALPFLSIVIRSPTIFILIVACSLLCQLIGALVFLIILPEEWDASFNKAMPILFNDNYVPDCYHNNVKQILKAAALTYFAAALARILHIGRWWLILRR